MAGVTYVYILFGTMIVLIYSNYPVTCQGFTECRESYFLSNGDCIPCPDHCKACISNTNCTRCTDNHYGPFCQHACKEECTDQCHKEYGYCTYGCDDGRFPEKDSAYCSSCPSHCTICKSSTECVSCRSGYHGNTCEYTCTNNCHKCDQVNGHCLECAEGYFNKGEHCHRCPEGCVSCNDNNNCSICKDTYLKLHDGHCISECPANNSAINIITNVTCEYEISNTHMFEDCLVTGNAQGAVCKTRGPCIKYMPCPSTDTCSSKVNTVAGCAELLLFECTRTCHLLNGNMHQCDVECNTENMTAQNPIICMSSSEPFSVGSRSTTSECLSGSSGATNGHGLWVSIVTVILAIGLLCISIRFGIRRKRCFNCKSTRKPPGVEKGIELRIHTNADGFVKKFDITEESIEPSEDIRFIHGEDAIRDCIPVHMNSMTKTF